MSTEKQNGQPDTGQQTKRNNLTFPQMYHLCELLRQYHAKFAEERVSRDDACTFLTARAGFPVTLANLGTAIDATKLDWVPKRSSPRAGSRGLVQQLYAAVCDLYARLGEPVPQALQEAAAFAERDREAKRAQVKK